MSEEKINWKQITLLVYAHQYEFLRKESYETKKSQGVLVREALDLLMKKAEKRETKNDTHISDTKAVA